MVYHREGDDDVSETGNWNVAQIYSNLKVMKLLYLADELENIAVFGSADIVEDILNAVQGVNKDELRLTGYKRLIRTLLMLINNTIFAVKKNGKEKLEDYKQDLIIFEKNISNLYEWRYNHVRRTRRIYINEPKFKLALDRVIELKGLINSPLNDADLIFTSKPNIDAKEMKKKIFENFTEKG
jgi:hypothetical protein